MDTLSDGILAPAPHSPSLITPLPAAGDIPDAPIILSSDSAPSPLPVPESTRGEHEAGKFTDHAAASPPSAGAGKATTPSANSSIEGSDPSNVTPLVTDLQGPPSERTPEEKLWDFKTRAQQYARDRKSCDDVRISYLEFLETEAEDDLALARMIAG
jgi:hypothetical protein